MALMRLRQAVRQPDIGSVGSGFCSPSACGRTYHSGSGPQLNSSLERSRISITAAQASVFSGITRLPASVLLLRTVSTLSIRSTSRHRRPRISPARIVVLSASFAARRAICHSGRATATLSRWAFSLSESARPRPSSTFSGRYSSAFNRCHRCAFTKTPRRRSRSRLMVAFDTPDRFRLAIYSSTRSVVMLSTVVQPKQAIRGLLRSRSV
jgi:hypothetical protein